MIEKVNPLSEGQQFKKPSQKIQTGQIKRGKRRLELSKERKTQSQRDSR